MRGSAAQPYSECRGSLFVIFSNSFPISIFCPSSWLCFCNNAIILINRVRSNFSIPVIVINSSVPSVGEVAYFLNSRGDIRAVDRRVDATRRAISSCDSNPAGKRCESRSQTREERYSVLIDLWELTSNGSGRFECWPVSSVWEQNKLKSEKVKCCEKKLLIFQILPPMLTFYRLSAISLQTSSALSNASVSIVASVRNIYT